MNTGMQTSDMRADPHTTNGTLTGVTTPNMQAGPTAEDAKGQGGQTHWTQVWAGEIRRELRC